ncbi:aminopeptidase M1-like [Prunus yedoensis var. nudiflora]|uniref:Aminopeptidase M1-like n=1 Tax=Prunus yedoensis var. nudiflora TaxID=2094558 RepID=A0A314YBK4_PRUYE|nr:aminopeptidase M1-like [Prunus yedoensis var. nudiflora]
MFDSYFAVPYSLPKLDMVAIPDFPGAMENYGLDTYQETALLFDEQNSAAANKQWTKFLDEITVGLKLDGLGGSHPIEASGHAEFLEDRDPEEVVGL